MTSRFGLTFGFTLCGMTHASVLPMMGLAEKPEDQPPCEHPSELVTHAICGVTTELVRRRFAAGKNRLQNRHPKRYGRFVRGSALARPYG